MTRAEIEGAIDAYIVDRISDMMDGSGEYVDTTDYTRMEELAIESLIDQGKLATEQAERYYYENENHD